MARQHSASSEDRQNRLHSVSLWLLLAAIFTHALLPVGSPLVRTAGSAFSTATADVSLAPTRKMQADAKAEAASEDADGHADGASPDAAVPASPIILIPQADRVALTGFSPVDRNPDDAPAAAFRARAPPVPDPF